MGLGFSSSGESAEYRDETIDVLKKSDPELYDRLMSHVSRDLDEKYSNQALPQSAPALRMRSMPIGVDSHTEGLSKPEAQLGDYVFPFENLVFEGGGGKGRIYYGALKCLQEAGIKGKRFSGASAGAITATLLAINLPLDIVQKYISLDLTNILNDHSYGYLSVLPNLLRYFGWNRGERFLEFFGNILEEHTGNKDITFEQVYRQFGNELCVVAVNTNVQAVEYFHMKTTPDMTVRLAVRMSMSIPGFFAAVPFADRNSRTNYYVDGGVICNYPVHVFDGWWLSLKPEDSFYKRLRPLSNVPKLMDKQERFGVFNERTLGFLVYASGEDEIEQVELEKRIADINVPRPDTPLFRKREAEAKGKFKPLLAHAALTRATDKFFEALRDADLANEGDATISRAEFSSVFANLKQTANSATGKFTKTDASLLFGEGYDVDKIFKSLDLDNDGVISYAEMCTMLDKSLGMNRRFLGYARRDIGSLMDFAKVLFSALQMQSMKVYMTGRDLERTVGLNTDYVGTMDFALDDADVEFLTQRGYETTKAFLLKYATSHNLEKRKAQA